jgi:diguanylate cyclase (GGDEF)-like protein
VFVVITQAEAEQLRDQLQAVLAEDARNTERLLARLESISRESGVGAHAAALLILTRLAFEEQDARRHWQAILSHRDEISRAVGRDIGVRVAVLDYFMNFNRKAVEPALIDLELQSAVAGADQTDGLTGMRSDRAFRAELQMELRRAKRYGLQVALILMDLDDFTALNERLGSLICDRLLRELAIVLHNSSRDIDVVARPGEDEISVLLPETDRNGGLLVAERYRRQAERFFASRESGGKPVELTLSAGVACYPDDASTPEELLQRAAQALYQAKATGKNTVQPYLPERRRYLRFDLEPGRFEVEVLEPTHLSGAARNLSRNGILFASPEALEVGEEIEIRLSATDGEADALPLRMRGRVVRLEELPLVAGGSAADPAVDDRYEIGVAFSLDWADGTEDLLQFLERAQARRAGQRP